ncbi:hypothetical protein NEPAR06_2401 [Nematocida parisii]|uniref:Uncharacterized protein n=1 Tax=Nematocida parisii (strain ERTm3) TaxID=935791 RepID=I3EF96_NEMP3|nr:uncharacterized protein NEPG_02065 [Nematocida parisii ERTm1]EIJ87893.1 hypothetical protein NEQG_01965 [Nematocida parisii ERTm3]KAI5128151.1 hypothetical protein NEPAR08_1066 [Nematocida parisii]EIJ93109.1 hypothetical protein NEPG_02065 [Nematocida parisii ERTm1]KAI5128352.1 hypothetical protein NEPAR03_1261 [Nematocida parisii]KAI5141669.1 hypothetical protein NEPAR04_1141 [Nematocida parisii]|eukprot:XP_013059892.1 hypothetical protein NEPG_02065 [Nematocida parisii ERTm1]
MHSSQGIKINFRNSYIRVILYYKLRNSIYILNDCSFINYYRTNSFITSYKIMLPLRVWSVPVVNQ